MQATPVFLLEEFQGQGSLVGYSPQGCKELDTTELTDSNNHINVVKEFYISKDFISLVHQ